jgi:hypothetical protein
VITHHRIYKPEEQDDYDDDSRGVFLVVLVHFVPLYISLTPIETPRPDYAQKPMMRSIIHKLATVPIR